MLYRYSQYFKHWGMKTLTKNLPGMDENLCFTHYNHLFSGLVSWYYPF
jgi:hypothetical protein